MFTKHLLLANVLLLVTLVTLSQGAVSLNCFEEEDTEFEGSDLPNSKPITVASAEACHGTCQDTDGCTFYTYNKGSKLCTFKTSDEGRVARKGSVSGPKVCRETKERTCKTNADGKKECIGGLST